MHLFFFTLHKELNFHDFTTTFKDQYVDRQKSKFSNFIDFKSKIKFIMIRDFLLKLAKISFDLNLILFFITKNKNKFIKQFNKFKLTYFSLRVIYTNLYLKSHYLDFIRRGIKKYGENFVITDFSSFNLEAIKLGLMEEINVTVPPYNLEYYIRLAFPTDDDMYDRVLNPMKYIDFNKPSKYKVKEPLIHLLRSNSKNQNDSAKDDFDFF